MWVLRSLPVVGLIEFFKYFATILIDMHPYMGMELPLIFDKTDFKELSEICEIYGPQENSTPWWYVVSIYTLIEQSNILLHASYTNFIKNWPSCHRCMLRHLKEDYCLPNNTCGDHEGLHISK